MVWQKVVVVAVGALSGFVVNYYFNRRLQLQSFEGRERRQERQSGGGGEGGGGGPGGGLGRGGGQQERRSRTQEKQHDEGSRGRSGGGGGGGGPEGGGRHEERRRTWRSEEETDGRERSRPLTLRRRTVKNTKDEKDNGDQDRQTVKEGIRQRRETSLVNTTEESNESDVQIASRNAPEIYSRVAISQQSVSRKLSPNQKTKMEVPKDNVGVWRFGEENFFTSVPKVWTVSDCIAHVRNKIGRHGYGDIDLWIKNRCIMLDKGKSLSDYPGLKSLHVVKRPTSRNPHPHHQTPRKDDTDPFCEDTCVGMCCGHAISPDNLYDYAWQKIQNGATEVTCPAIPDVNKPIEQCSQVWEFKSISLLACLSDDENYLFCEKLFLNWLEKEADIHICPVCNEAILSNCASVFKCFNCENSGKSHSFCIKCNGPVYGNLCFNNECQESLPKVQALLKNCRMRTIIGVPNCPSVRACPACQFVIEFDEEDNCKHMTCPRNTCQAQFCFICLKVKTDKYYYPCGGAFQACPPCPRQII